MASSQDKCECGHVRVAHVGVPSDAENQKGECRFIIWPPNPEPDPDEKDVCPCNQFELKGT